MKLKHFNIKNIKSIIDSGTCHLSDENITIFAGQNESGKSAVLEALKYFSKGPDENFKKYSMRINGGTPFVECCFALCDENDFGYKDENVEITLKELKEIQCYREGENKIKFSPATTKKLIEVMSCMNLSNNKNVIVEGVTDKYYLEAFAKLLNIQLEHNIIPSAGHDNIKHIANVLLGWGYDFKVIIDGGEGNKPKEAKTEKLIKEKLFAFNNEAAREKIKRLTQCAIEDCFTVQDFNNYVKPEDVESRDISNSALAKQEGKKELWARLFIEKVNNGELEISNFEQATLDNFKEILNWIQGT